MDRYVFTNLLFLTDAIFQTGVFGVPSKSHKSFICRGVGQTITLKSPGKGAPPSVPSPSLQMNDLCDLLGTPNAPGSKIVSVKWGLKFLIILSFIVSYYNKPFILRRGPKFLIILSSIVSY